MSRSLRGKLRQSLVWCTVFLMAFQPTIAGQCGGQRPLQQLFAKSPGLSCHSACCTPACPAPEPCPAPVSSVVYYDCCPTFSCCVETIVAETNCCAGEVVTESTSWESCPEPIVDSCCGYDTVYVGPSYTESAPVDEGYVSSYVTDSSDCGCGESVIVDSGCADCVSGGSEGVIVEEGVIYAPVESGVISEGEIIVEDAGSSTRNEFIEDLGSGSPYEIIEDTTSSTQNEFIEDAGSSTRNEIIEDAGSGTRNDVMEEAGSDMRNDLLEDAGTATRDAFPVEEQPAAVQPPADAAPAATEPVAPESVEAADPGDELGDDLGDFMEEETPAEGDFMEEAGIDDLPAEEPPAEDAGDDLMEEANDLFDETPVEDAEEDLGELDDLFGTAAPKPQPIATRTWTDNTGQYTTVGQLDTIGTDFVRILKTNQRYSTVPMHRLSPTDIVFVQRVAKRLNVKVEFKVAAN